MTIKKTSTKTNRNPIITLPLKSKAVQSRDQSFSYKIHNFSFSTESLRDHFRFLGAEGVVMVEHTHLQVSPTPTPRMQEEHQLLVKDTQDILMKEAAVATCPVHRAIQDGSL